MNLKFIDDMLEQMYVIRQQLSKQSSKTDITIEQAYVYFFIYMENNNYNPATIAYYKGLVYSLNIFFNANGYKYVSEIDDPMIEKLKIQSINRGLSNSTINKLIKMIKRICKVLANQDIIEEKVFKSCILKTVENRIDDLSEETIDLIFSNFDNFSIKDQAIIYILYDTGVRRTELCNIKIANINFDDNSILLEKTKAGKIRTVFFTDDCKKVIIKYLNKDKPETYLFNGRIPGLPISPHRINTMLNEKKVYLNLDKLSAHQFRHTFGTRIYNNSNDIELTRVLLGHADFTMTKRYIHHSTSEIKEKYDRINSKVSRSKRKK